MALGCNCEAGLSNTGRPNCVPIQSVTSKLIMVNLKANDGTENYIDTSTTLPVWSTLVNQTDASKRWFPLPSFENVELPKADSQFEEANSGRMAFLRQGKRSFAGELWGDDSTPTLLGKMNAGRCVEFGIYIVDVVGNLVGSKVGDKLYPIPVDNESWDPKFNFATDSTVQKIMLGFDFNRLFDESTMYMIQPDEAGINFNDLEGLIDVNFANVVQTAADITFDAQFDYGTAVNALVFKGGVPGDFKLTENGAVVTITGGQENVPLDGNYTLNYAFNVGDNYVLSMDKDGFSGSYKFVG